ncbi:MAG TPA: gluconate 2-dehydrogenase subunit 3 family protein [Puia sp.]|nr:gluconate 2-dehydrogenase subunit 3 family protein [Puia sp.]
MQRREALQMVALLMGGTVIGADAFLSGCKTPPRKEGLFYDTDVALMDEIGETILPAGPGVPGAREAGIGEFMKVIVTDCYTPGDQDVFVKGLQSLRDKKFMDMTADQRHELLVQLDKEARDPKNKDKKQPYFSMLKQLTIWGYFTSEAGATKACRYIETPGRYDGDVPYKKGDKVWAI